MKIEEFADTIDLTEKPTVASPIEPVVMLTLNASQMSKLEDVISSYLDEGPSGSGWQSDELERLVCEVRSQIEKQKAT